MQQLAIWFTNKQNQLAYFQYNIFYLLNISKTNFHITKSLKRSTFNLYFLFMLLND